MMKYLRYKSRDNARTPVQWDDSPNAGFTTGTPWIMVNPNYKKINAKDQLAREDSVFHYYQKLIALRHEKDIIVYGDYALLLPEHPAVYAYTRSLDGEMLLVLCNFSGEEQDIRALCEDYKEKETELWISNYENASLSRGKLRPYEAAVFYFPAK